METAGEFVARTWSPGALAPSAQGKTFDGELVLDRIFLGVTDGSVSRAENAPKLRATSASTVEVEVPERSARAVVAIEGLRFEDLQREIPPAGEAWKVAPAELTRKARLVFGDQVSLALVRQLAWDRPGATHHLVVLPRALKIRQGETRTVIAPAILVVGQAAIDLTPSDTLVPAAAPRTNEKVRSFRLADVEAKLEGCEGVEGLWVTTSNKSLRVPEYDGELGATEVERAAASLLEDARFRFVPVLEEEQRALLALAYRRSDGTVGMMVSGGEPGEFVEKVQAFVTTNGAGAPARRTRPPAAVPLDPLARFGEVETRSALFAQVLSELSKVAAADIAILFLGESGTGKEHLARAVHAASPRAKRPFVAVNCSALSEELIESELFGHVRGAFTGAHGDRDGAFVAADGGTLLLDEIGDAPARVQVALLRALETRAVKPVGSDAERSVDVRVLAATSRDVDAMMVAGEFRRDLYYRLAEASVALPPLRDRPEDIPSLASLLLDALAPGMLLSSQAERALTERLWPGNVRELKNALKRAVALARGTGLLQAVHFAPFGDAVASDPPPPERPLVFPPHVLARAQALWSGADPGRPDDASKHEHRARERAALLCLKARTPITAWPKALSQQWHRLFGARWATTEEGRGLRELVRELGLDPRDENVREGVRARVERA